MPCLAYFCWIHPWLPLWFSFILKICQSCIFRSSVRFSQKPFWMSYVHASNRRPSIYYPGEIFIPSMSWYSVFSFFRHVFKKFITTSNKHKLKINCGMRLGAWMRNVIQLFTEKPYFFYIWAGLRFLLYSLNSLTKSVQWKKTSLLDRWGPFV